MATGKKKGSSGNGGTKNRKNTKNERGRSGEQNAFAREIALWIVIAVSLLLFISNFGIGGTVGNAVSRFFFGIFGLVAYLFPLALLAGIFFAVSNKGNVIAVVKMVSACLFVSFLCMLIELVRNGAAVVTALDAYRYGYENKAGGGLIGGFFAKLICPNFGLLGSYIIAVIVCIICFVLITERSALQSMKSSGKKVYESAKITNERHREIAEARREERKLRRMDRKVEGVAIDTRILPKEEKEASDEISEIHLEEYIDLPVVREESRVTLTAENTSYREDVPTFAFEKNFSAEKELKPEEPIICEPTMEEPAVSQPAMEEPSVSESERLQPKQRETAIPAKSNFATANTDDVSDIARQISGNTEQEKTYLFPPVSLLAPGTNKAKASGKRMQETAMKLQQTLKNFGVNVTITNISCGPAVTRYELSPEMGVKVSKIVNLADDIKLNLAAADIRIEAPIPGKAAIGIEVPNGENVTVPFRELVESDEFKQHASKLAFCVGKDIAGKVMVTDIGKMPHLLIAGSTGSGKSVCINTIVMSILYKADPREVKLIMVDPKVVELSVYNGIPHLLIPVVTDPKKAAGALHWAVAEMTERYQKFAEANVRDLKGYNAKVESIPPIDGEPRPEKLPQIVIIVDELADLMMVAPGDVEEAICRLAQLARAAGIHLIIATQRPSVNVITGLIKANMPSRIAFAVTSGIDSRTILDMNGAEKLLGKGDMLFHPQGAPKPIRVQGAFISDKEVSDVVGFLKEQNSQVTYSADIEERLNSMEAQNMTVGLDGGGGTGDGRDPYFMDAARLLIEKEKGSIGMLQRYFKVGFNRAARIMDQLEEAGIVGPEEGTKPRRVMMSLEQFEQMEEE